MKQDTIKKMHEQADKTFGYTLSEVADYRESWRIFRIMAEFVEGYQFLSGLEKEVTILGSARLPEDHKHYKLARDIGKGLANAGFTVVTGGGPGIMEAANRGAKEVGGQSIGLNIQLPFEQVVNPYVTKSTSFSYFFTRKVMLTAPASAFVFCPGGFGTLDEFFEVVDHIDLGFMAAVPIILVGSEFWNPVLEFLRGSCCKLGSITEEQIKVWHVVDTTEEVLEIVNTVKEKPDFCDLSANNFQCYENIDWRVFRIMAELVEGFEFVSGVKDGITVLGTKSLEPGTADYEAAYNLGKELALKNYPTITGGKTGVAEAVSKGTRENNGTAIGIDIKSDDGMQDLNPYLSKSILFRFPFTRKLIVTAPTKAFVFFPGGFGTLHHLFQVLTLMQTEKIKKIPVILYNREFWQSMQLFVKKVFVHDFVTVSDEDDELFQVVDDYKSILPVIEDFQK